MGRERGEVIGEKYILEGCLGGGGMGSVYLARDLHTGQLWAVKEVLVNDASLQTISAEVETLKRIKSKRLPMLVDLFWEKGAAYIVQEYMEGETLDQVLRRKKVFSTEEALKIGKQIAKTLLELHSLVPPVVYGDLKPANIIVGKQGELKLIDFGTSVFTEKKLSPEDWFSYGTIGYTAPEVWGTYLEKAVVPDIRADIFSFGILLYEMISGEKPVNEQEIHIEKQPLIPLEMVDIIEKCLRINKKERYESIQEVIREMGCLQKEEKTRKKKYFLKNIFFIFWFACTILLFSMSQIYADTQGNNIWMYLGTLLLWIISITWYRFICKKQSGTMRGERFRFLATGKKTAGLLLLLCLFTTMTGSLVTESEALKLEEGGEKKTGKIVTDEYGRKLIIRRNIETETESREAGLH